MKTKDRSTKNIQRVIRRKVIHHLMKAQKFFATGYPKKALKETNIAYRNSKLEKVKDYRILSDIAGLYNNIASELIKRDEVQTSFRLLTRSLALKQQIRVHINPESVKGTIKNYILSGILACEFPKVLEQIEQSNDMFKGDSSFIKYLKTQKKVINQIIQNEPAVGIYFPTISSKNIIQPLPSGIYLPKIFSKLEAKITNLTLKFVDFETLQCNIDFSVEHQDKTIKTIENPYDEDPWKNRIPEEFKPEIEKSTPNLVVFLDSDEYIPRNSVELIDNQGYQSCESQTLLSDVYIPESYPRFGYSFLDTQIIPNCKDFLFFRGIANVFEWKLKLGKQYRLQFQIKARHAVMKANLSLQMNLGFLIPFKFTMFQNIKILSLKALNVDETKLNPIKYFKEHTGANIIPVKDFEPKSLESKAIANREQFIITDPFCYTLENSNLLFNDYCMLGFHLKYNIADGEVCVSTRTWDEPIPIGIYHLVMDKKFGFPPIVTYNVANNSDTEVKLVFTTELKSVCNEEKSQVTIHPKSIGKIEHTPTIDHNKRKEIIETQVTDLVCHVEDEQHTILIQTKKQRLLAYDTMIWEISNPSNGAIFNLSDFVSAWVTPHTKGMEIDQLIKHAKEVHPQKVLVGYQGNPNSVEEKEKITSEQSKAIFNALKQKYNLSYVSSTISFGWHKRFLSQRIKLPSISIQTRSANCIDGTVLFASALEQIGIEPILVLVPGHAFVGWKIWTDSDVYTFLETTLISSTSYEEAVTVGRNELLKNLKEARIRSQNPGLNLEMADKLGLIRFINITEMRKIGILPMAI